jgi:hypothetical protein
MNERVVQWAMGRRNPSHRDRPANAGLKDPELTRFLAAIQPRAIAVDTSDYK